METSFGSNDPQLKETPGAVEVTCAWKVLPSDKKLVTSSVTWVYSEKQQKAVRKRGLVTTTHKARTKTKELFHSMVDTVCAETTLRLKAAGPAHVTGCGSVRCLHAQNLS